MTFVSQKNKHVGPSDSGHFIKTVHNGIEYDVMQFIGEVYKIIKDILKMPNDEIVEVKYTCIFITLLIPLFCF